MPSHPAILLALAASTVTLAGATAPRPAAAIHADDAVAARDRDLARRAAWVDRLERTPAPPRLDGSLRQALERLSEAGAVEIRGLWKDRFTPGLDPDRTVQCRLRPDASCMEAVEALLHEIDDGGEPVLWQATTQGFEVGFRSVLWRPRAMETRLYDVTDLVLRARHWRASGLPQGAGPGGGSSGAQGGGQAGGSHTEVPDPGRERQARVEELMQLIQQVVEPQAWQRAGGPCTIVNREGLVVIRAPDFVHRRIENPSAAPSRKPRKPADGDRK